MVKRNKVVRVSLTELERALEKVGLPSGSRIVTIDQDVRRRDAVLVVWHEKHDPVDVREAPPEVRLGEEDALGEAATNPAPAPVEALRRAVALVRRALTSGRNRLVLRRVRRGTERDVERVDVDEERVDLTVVLDEDADGEG